MNQRADNVSDNNLRISLSLFTLSLWHVSLTTVLLPAALEPCGADPAPMENLAHVDVALIDRAEPEIDLAAYVLTDWPIMQGLTCAAEHGVQIHTYLDGTQLGERELTKVFHDLAETPASSFCRLA